MKAESEILPREHNIDLCSFISRLERLSWNMGASQSGVQDASSKPDVEKLIASAPIVSSPLSAVVWLWGPKIRSEVANHLLQSL